MFFKYHKKGGERKRKSRKKMLKVCKKEGNNALKENGLHFY